MTTRKMILGAAALLVGGAVWGWAQTNSKGRLVTLEWYGEPLTVSTGVFYDVEVVLKDVKQYGQMEELVKTLATQGHICNVYGHSWRGGRPGEGDGVTFADYHPNTVYRTCKICGKCVSRNTDNWE